MSQQSSNFRSWAAVVHLQLGTNVLIAEAADTPGNTNANAASVVVKREDGILSSPLCVALVLTVVSRDSFAHIRALSAEILKLVTIYQTSKFFLFRGR